jgi:DNA adenine methylase
MASRHSPLRYPGGKQILARVLGQLIKLNGVEGGTYAEPYAGGAGAALSLLFGEHVERILINDLDPCVHALWKSILDRTDAFLQLLRQTPTTDKEWCRQRDIYRRRHRRSILQVGFATFFLNRCNRSGIIETGGPIGGRHQRGKWKIDARFNREDLAKRIERIALYRDRIELFNLDAIVFLRTEVGSNARSASRTFVYLDPPYYRKGRDLYLSFYEPNDHRELAKFIRRQTRFRWVMSYDNVPEIRALYTGLRQIPFDLDYSASKRRVGKEVLILPDTVDFPHNWRSRIPDEVITSAARLRIAV